VATVRDEHGLALSSRNAYLSAEQIATARKLNKILFAMADKIARGEICAEAETWGKKELAAAGFDSVDYLEVRDAKSLAPVAAKDGKELRILAAVRLGKARLIDNVAA
jgi:pantoate--beta-alanine ligase